MSFGPKIGTTYVYNRKLKQLVRILSEKDPLGFVFDGFPMSETNSREEFADWLCWFLAAVMTKTFPETLFHQLKGKPKSKKGKRKQSKKSSIYLAITSSPRFHFAINDIIELQTMFWITKAPLDHFTTGRIRVFSAELMNFLVSWGYILDDDDCARPDNSYNQELENNIVGFLNRNFGFRHIALFKELLDKGRKFESFVNPLLKRDSNFGSGTKIYKKVLRYFKKVACIYFSQTMNIEDPQLTEDPQLMKGPRLMKVGFSGNPSKRNKKMDSHVSEMYFLLPTVLVGSRRLESLIHQKLSAYKKQDCRSREIFYWEGANELYQAIRKGLEFPGVELKNIKDVDKEIAERIAEDAVIEDEESKEKESLIPAICFD